MLDLLSQGGWVMYVLFACSIISLAIILERVIYFIRTRESYTYFENLLQPYQGDAVNQSAVLPDNDAGSKYLGVIVRTFQEHQSKQKEALEEILQKKGSQQIKKMESGLSILSSISVLSPLMGLLGTVLGMIACFKKIHAMGAAADVAALAGGIWEALFTTAFGLIIAIVVTGIHHYFENIVHTRKDEMHYLVTDLFAVFGK